MILTSTEEELRKVGAEEGRKNAVMLSKRGQIACDSKLMRSIFTSHLRMKWWTFQTLTSPGQKVMCVYLIRHWQIVGPTL